MRLPVLVRSLSALLLLIPSVHAELREAPYLREVLADPQNSDLYWGIRPDVSSGGPNQSKPAILYRSLDRGVTWRGLRFNGNPAVNPYIHFLKVHPTIGGRAYVLADSTGGYLWMTTDGGFTWTNPGAAFPPGLTPKGLVVAAGNVYVQLDTQLFRSADSGATFESGLATPCDASRGVSLLGSPAAPDRISCIGTDRRFRYSTNRGTTWNNGAVIVITASSSPFVFAHPTNPLEFYIYGISGVSYVYLRSTDGLQSVTTTTAAPGGSAPAAISPDGGLMLHRNLSDNLLYRSRDFGRTWEGTSSPGPGGTLVAAYHLTGGDQVLMSVDSTDRVLKRSQNAAGSFTAVDAIHVPLLTPFAPIDATVEAGAGYDPLPLVQDIIAQTYMWSALTATPDANAPWLRNLPPLYATSSGLAVGDYQGTATVSTSGFDLGKLEVQLKVVASRAPQISFLSSALAGNGTRITSQPAAAGPFVGQNGPALSSPLSVLVGRTASDAQGNIYIADARRVRKVSTDGSISNFAGTGENGQFGDGGLAINSAFQSVGNILSTPGGLLIVDWTSVRVRRVLANGTIETFYAPAGNQFPRPSFSTNALALDSQGNLYMADYNGVYRRESNGNWTNVFFHSAIGSNLGITDLRGFAIDTTNDSFILAYDDRVYRRTQGGVVTLLLGAEGKFGFTGDNGNGGQNSQTDNPTAIATDSRGNVFVSEHNRVRVIRPDGTVGTVAGNGGFTNPPGNGGAAISGGYGKILHVARHKDNELLLFSDLGYIFTLKEGAAPTSFIYPGGIVTITGRPKIAQGSIFSVYGEGLSGSSGSGPAPPLATDINGTKLEVNGAAIPLFYASPGLINAQLPFDVPLGFAQVRVIRNGAATGIETVEVVPAAPDIIEYGDKWGVAVNLHDGSLNSQATPAKVGSFAVLYFTGAGIVSPAQVAGIAAGSTAPFSSPVLPYKLTLTKDGVPTDITPGFLGHTPTTAGLLQANLSVPNLTPGVYTLTLTIGTAVSNPVKFALAP